MGHLTKIFEKSLRFEIVGIDNIPISGPAILVMNHSAIPIDGMLLVTKFFNEKGRVIRSLASKNLRKHPFIRETVLLWGGVDGNAVNAVNLLKRKEIILIYPGGPKEGIKNDKMKYKLIWNDEYRFIKLALLTGAPVVPVASIGLDENFHLISQGSILNQILFGPDAFLLPIVTPTHIVPHKVVLYVGEPIKFGCPPQAAKNTALVQQLQHQVQESLENLIAQHKNK